MSKRAIIMALRKVVGSRQTGMLPTGAKKMARREASAANIEDMAVLNPNRARASQMNAAAMRLRTSTRPTASVMDNEFTPARAMTKAEKRRDLIMRETADLTDSTPFVTRERIWKARSNERTKRIADRARD